MTASAKLSASLEDYLEAIFQIVSGKQAVRAKDISARMGVTRPSVTGALHALSEKGMINYAPYDVITLTDEGRDIAEDVVRRHEVIHDFFVTVLSVPEQQANEAACRMEHAVGKELLDRFIRFLEFVESCPRGGSAWVKGFGYYCNSRNSDSCERCVSRCLEDVRNTKMEKMEKQEAGQDTVTLNKLKPGQKGRIARVKGGGPATRRIVEMGVTTGTLIEVERIAPLGDPIEVKVKGYHLSLRKEEAENIFVVLS